ncbi:LuxR family transcriptional regulator [Rhizobium sp. Leaf371]|uniref:ATP-binding protein n=1 Tax=Rhizobium sp. Leaf371 TaxID=1736355 RepID=UPI0007163901|nr:LuxR family transcriptional regulator [Rhizobium sp. Leaf371]KQS71398.1 LuxR family transcriptional regulator [Rhizobium sp. Leaf371]
MLLEREDATQTLLTTLRDASAGRGRVVVIEGEPGIGKTALLQSFDALVGDTHSVHWGWNDPLATPRPLGALQDMTAITDTDVGEMLRRGASPEAIFSSVLNALVRAPQSIVLIFEDLHWADTATLDLIRFLGRRISLLKAMIVLTIRRTDVDRNHPAIHLLGDLPSVTRIAMEPLSREAVEALAGEGQDGHSVFMTTGGNPFFVMELLADGNRGEGHLPVSVRDAVWARWSRLPPAMREFLDIVSILPGGASAAMVPALTGEDAEELALQCVERGLLRWDEMGTLVFRHELARQATLERLSPASQRALHARMEDIFAAMPASDSDPSILAQRLHHITLSGNIAGVLDLAPKAAAQAALLGAHLQAATHLTTALAHVALAPPPIAAQIYEDWAHETFLAGSVSSEETMRAYTFAISLWRSQGQIEKVGLNLCRLARLHWRRGETDLAVSYTEQAVRELEGRPPSNDLALAYSTRSQLLMLQDRFDEAIVWGRRAMELSDKLGQVETRIHALNNVGTSLAFAGQVGGDALLEESLALALEYGFHDHASRAYTNLSECCMLFRDFSRADRLMTEGIAFCVQHDLDAAAHYLLGHHAQLRMEQGRLQEALMIAEGVMSKEGYPRVMLLPALSVLARVKMRLGLPDGFDLLANALEAGQTTGEPQRIIPVRLALTEAAWLRGAPDEAKDHVNALLAMSVKQFSSWDLGELHVWRTRLSLPISKGGMEADLPAPRAAELAGDFDRAAELWFALEQPYEGALSLMQVTGEAAAAALSRAVTILDGIEARLAAGFARTLAERMGVGSRLPRRRRGSYAAARLHPLGLTSSEQKVLALLVQGLGNKEIARALSRSQRTIEHQVSSVLGKFNAGNRMEVLLRVQSEPWLVERGG